MDYKEMWNQLKNKLESIKKEQDNYISELYDSWAEENEMSYENGKFTMIEDIQKLIFEFIDKEE